MVLLRNVFAYTVVAVVVVVMFAVGIAAVAFGLILLVPVGIIGGTWSIVKWIRERHEVRNLDDELAQLLKEGK